MLTFFVQARWRFHVDFALEGREGEEKVKLKTRMFKLVEVEAPRPFLQWHVWQGFAILTPEALDQDQALGFAQSTPQRAQNHTCLLVLEAAFTKGETW